MNKAFLWVREYIVPAICMVVIMLAIQGQINRTKKYFKLNIPHGSSKY